MLSNRVAFTQQVEGDFNENCCQYHELSLQPWQQLEYSVASFYEKISNDCNDKCVLSLSKLAVCCGLLPVS